jgi:peroxiredoxin
VTAVAADSVEDTAALQTTLKGVTLVSDTKLAASDAWGRHVPGADNPLPATYIVDGNGTIEWRHLPDKNGDWPTYAELSAALKL